MPNSKKPAAPHRGRNRAVTAAPRAARVSATRPGRLNPIRRRLTYSCSIGTSTRCAVRRCGAGGIGEDALLDRGHLRSMFGFWRFPPNMPPINAQANSLSSRITAMT